MTKQLWLPIVSLFLLTTSCATSPHAKTEAGQTSVTPTRVEALAREQAALRAKQISHVSYVLWFGLEETQFDGRAVIIFELRNKASELSPTLYLDFEGGQIKSMNINNQAVAEDKIQSRYDGHRIALQTNTELRPGANRIELIFSNTYATAGTGLLRWTDAEDKRVYLFTRLGPFDAHKVFPCFDQPDLKAPFEVTVEAPESWEVIANIQERDTTKVDGRRSWTFPPSPVLSPFLFALHAGEFEVWKSDTEGVPLCIFSRQSIAAKVDYKNWFEATREGMEALNEETGTPYPYPKYDQILSPFPSARLAQNAGAPVFSEEWVFPQRITDAWTKERKKVIFHDLAATWFGHLVTMRWWNALWLNEGIAGYLAAKDGYHTTYALDNSAATHPLDASTNDTDRARANLDEITHGKGPATVKQLAFLVGNDDFKEATQRFLQKFSFRNAALADFFKILSDAHGKNLTEWKRKWLDSTGFNTVQASWSCGTKENSNKNVVLSFVLKQSGGTELPLHKTRIALFKTGKKTLKPYETIDTEYNEGETPVPEALGKACPEFVFPNYQNYDYVKIQLDPISSVFAQTNLHRIDDPLTRQMTWDLWQQEMLDGQISPQELIDRIFKLLPKEKNFAVLSTALSGLTQEDLHAPTALKYVPNDLRANLTEKTETFIREQAIKAEAGSDTQMAWFKALLSIASSSESIELLQQTLKGKGPLSKLRQELKKLPERRNQIVQTLVRAGAENSEPLTIGSEARIPSHENKLKMFERLTRWPTDLSEPEIYEAANGMHVIHQDDLMNDTAPLFTKWLENTAIKMPEEIAAKLVSKLYPPQCNSPLALPTTLNLPPYLLQPLRLQQQEVERCNKLRAVHSAK